MKVALVSVNVKPTHVDEFILASEANARESVKEPGNMRFDVLQSPDDPTHFVLYEAYETAEAAAAHKDTPHYKTWRDTVATWMASPRSGDVYMSVFP